MSKVAKTVLNKEDMVFFNYTNIERVMRGPTIREISDKTVSDLVESFKHFGVLEPITVTHDGGLYTVIAGHHRFIAFKHLLSQLEPDNQSDYNLPATIVGIRDDDREALQISENLHRNDLSPAERKEMGARYGYLVTDQEPDGGQEPKKAKNPKGGQPESWFSVWSNDTGIPLKTAQRMWKEFADDQGIDVTPSKATKAQQSAFFAWHITKAEADRKAKAEAGKKSEDEVKAKALADALKAWKQKLETVQVWFDQAKAAGLTCMGDDLKNIH